MCSNELVFLFRVLALIFLDLQVRQPVLDFVCRFRGLQRRSGLDASADKADMPLGKVWSSMMSPTEKSGNARYCACNIS